MRKFKKLNPKQRLAVANEVKMMIAAHRDMLWIRWGSSWPKVPANQKTDPTIYQCDARCGYYGEAFGIMRGLIAVGYGYFGSDNLDAFEEGRSSIPEHNLKWWFSQLQKEYLVEEGYYDKTCSAIKCTQLLARYRELVRR